MVAVDAVMPRFRLPTFAGACAVAFLRRHGWSCPCHPWEVARDEWVGPTAVRFDFAVKRHGVDWSGSASDDSESEHEPGTTPWRDIIPSGSGSHPATRAIALPDFSHGASREDDGEHRVLREQIARVRSWSGVEETAELIRAPSARRTPVCSIVLPACSVLKIRPRRGTIRADDDRTGQPWATPGDNAYVRPGRDG
jgi:hypothetical protein